MQYLRVAGSLALLTATAGSVQAQQTVVTARGLPTWTLSAAPIVRIGDESDPRTYFKGIAAVRVPSGEIVIEDAGTKELRVFSAAGEFVKTLSRSGSGPGEFREGGALLRAGDTVIVVENPMGPRLLHFFTVADGFRKRMSFRPSGVPRGVSVLGRFDDGRYLVFEGSGMRIVEPNLDAGQLSRDSITLGVMTVGDSSLVARLGIFPDKTMFTYVSPFLRGQVTYHTPAYGPALVKAVSGDRAWVGDTGTGRISIYDANGRRTAEITMPVEARPVSRQAAARAQSREAADATTENQRAVVAAIYSDAALPRAAPCFSEFHAGVAGEMWIKVFDEDRAAPSRFLVLDRGGRAVSQATFPAGLKVHDIGRDYVLGTQTDADGVERVVLYRLAR